MLRGSQGAYSGRVSPHAEWGASTRVVPRRPRPSPVTRERRAALPPNPERGDAEAHRCLLDGLHAQSFPSTVPKDVASTGRFIRVRDWMRFGLSLAPRQTPSSWMELGYLVLFLYLRQC